MDLRSRLGSRLYYLTQSTEIVAACVITEDSEQSIESLSTLAVETLMTTYSRPDALFSCSTIQSSHRIAIQN